MIRLVATAQSRDAAELRRFFNRARNPGQGERRKVGDAIARGIGENFSAQRAGDGPPWAALAERTVLERLAQGYPGREPILRRSGRLRASYTQPGAADHVEEYETSGDGWSVAVGSRDSRAGILEDGGHTEDGSFVPPRPISILNRRSRERIGTTLDFVFDQVLEVGR